MGLIIDFFEYTISGWVFWIWFIFMIIFSLACLGVVGDKVSKKREAEAKARQLAAAEEEYRKAHELIEKQAQNSGIDVDFDPNANNQSSVNPIDRLPTSAVSSATQTPVAPVEQPVAVNSTSTPNVQQLTVTPTAPSTSTVSSVENASATPQETVPNVIVLDEKTNESSTSNNPAPSINGSVNVAAPAEAKSAIDNTDVESVKTDVPAVLIINEDGTSNT